ncbi:MAG TPA: hypothetical protein VEF04_18200 [Blastocatellia bacterium]|nr:hypothetical protein [Blastocatellia bacterium]
MKRLFLKIGVATLALLIGGVIYRASSNEPSHFWSKLGEAKVIYNGQPSPSAYIYCSPDGQVLIDLMGNNDALYVVITNKNYIGIPNRSNFYMLPGFVYSKELLPPTAPPGKWETEPNLIIQDGMIEFTSYQKAQVRVSW